LARTDTVFAGSIPAFYDRYLGRCGSPYAADVTRRLTGLTSRKIRRGPGANAPRLDAATDAAAAAIAARFGPGPITARMQAHVITAAA
jgi:hypothetical protein